MKKFALIAAAALTFGCFLTGCSNEPDPNETGGVVKGLPPGGAPEGAKAPSNPFANAPEGMGGPAGKGGMKGGSGGAPTPSAAGAPAPAGQ
jgi:hypothetical protein